MDYSNHTLDTLHDLYVHGLTAEALATQMVRALEDQFRYLRVCSIEDQAEWLAASHAAVHAGRHTAEVGMEMRARLTGWGRA